MNDFQIISKLGEGAYSTVFKVKRIIDNEIYALKKVKLLKNLKKEKKRLFKKRYCTNIIRVSNIMFVIRLRLRYNKHFHFFLYLI